jgi:polygalacturonase
MHLGKYIGIGTLAVLISAGMNWAAKETDDKEWLYENVEFDMLKVIEPDFPAYEVNIVDFGAKGDGLTDNTQSFADAIAQASSKGGGKVIVPRGIWLTGPITLKSNINLHVQDGALIQFDDDLDKYPLVETSFEGRETYRCTSPMNGKDLVNVAITGSGIIDGNGDAWRPVKSSKLTAAAWKKLVKSGGVLSDDEKTWYPSEESKQGAVGTGNFNVPDLDSREAHEKVKDFLRPVMVSLINCNKVLLDGPTFQNSPAWNIHPLMCENVILRNLIIRNPWYSQNGDGLDLESCKNVLIYNNSFDVGDDAICIKSGKNEDGLKRGMPTENVIIKNNTVYHGHGGFVVGSEMSGGVRNMHVSQCTFIGTDCGLRFKSTRGRGGVVEDIYISDIDMINIQAEAIRFNLFYGGESPVGSDGSINIQYLTYI